jgi:hypothetical protein
MLFQNGNPVLDISGVADIDVKAKLCAKEAGGQSRDKLPAA